ncbi:MAG: lipid-A-disaccharide synthase [Janthinobacterium lividum]
MMLAGEPSGDRQGAALLTALREQVAPRLVEAWGIGGHFMAGAGVRLLYNSEPWASIGIAQTLLNIPRLLQVQAEMKRVVKRDPPDALVLIDAGGFNVSIGRSAKENKVCPVFYYFPPGSWRRRSSLRPEQVGSNPKNKKKLSDWADRVVTPYPWSETSLRERGMDAHFVGHPLLDLVKPTLTDTEFYERFGLDPHRPIVALLPGSRKGEIRYILPLLIGAASEISHRIPGAQFVVALASSGIRTQAEELIRHEQQAGGRAARLQLFMAHAGDKLAQIAHTALTPALPQMVTNEGLILTPTEVVPERTVSRHLGLAPLVICEGLTWDTLSRCDLVLTKAGTATLEAMILKKPMVIVYNGPKTMAVEWFLRKRSLNISHIGMPNILADERLFAELIGEEASPEAIADLSVDLLLDPSRIMALKERLTDLVQHSLGEPGGVQRAAALLLDLIEHTKS